MDKDKIRKDITEARKHADVVMVFPHWGTENSHKVSDYQKEYTKLFSDLGVDIAIGSHPHVLQPVAWVTNEKSGKKMLVYYSLGKFISHQINLPQLCGGMAEVTIEKENGKITISSAKLAPVVCHYSRGGNGFVFSVYKLSDYTDELAATQAQKGATVKYFTDLSKNKDSRQISGHIANSLSILCILYKRRAQFLPPITRFAKVVEKPLTNPGQCDYNGIVFRTRAFR